MKLGLSLFLSFIPLLLFGEIRVVDLNANSVTVEFSLINIIEYPMEVNGKNYVTYSFDDAVFDGIPGKPAVPFFSSRLAVPSGSNVQYQISILEKTSRVGKDLVPHSISDSKRDSRSTPADPLIYGNPLPFPEKILEIGEAYEFRGINVVKILFNPVQYFPRDHRIEIYHKVEIKFLFNGGKIYTNPKKLTPSEANLLSHKILNYQQAAQFSVQQPFTLKKQPVNYDFSSGQWFRIPVHIEGIFQIKGEYLKSIGVDINSVQLANVHLYNYGGFRLPIDVNQNRPENLNEIALKVVDENNNGIMDEVDRIVFYGRGLGNWKYDSLQLTWRFEEFPYDDTNYYLLCIDNQAGKRMMDSPSPQLSNPEVPTTFTDFFRFEEDRYNILSSGLDWYWLKMSGLQDQKRAEINLPQNIADGRTRLVFNFKGGSGSFYGDDEAYRYDLRTILNGEVVIDNFTLTRSSAGQKVVSKDNLFAVMGGKNDLEVQHTGNLSGCEVYLDYLEISLERPLVAENERLHFRKIVGNNLPVEFRITGLPSGENEVWDISDFANIKIIKPLTNGQTVTFQDIQPDIKGGEYIVFSENSIQDVLEMESIENHPNLRDPSRKAQFLIITPEEFYEEASFLEDWRESQLPHPLITERVLLWEIFQEFSSSVKDVVAIRDFIRYVYQNWSDTLKYVLLFGDGHYDYRQIQLQDYPNYIPPFEISDNSEVDSRETDNFYVSLGMQDNLNNIDPWLSIARIPVNNPEQIEVFKEKASFYRYPFSADQIKNGWQTWITLVADDQFGGIGSNNEWFHVQPTEEVSTKYIPDKFNLTKIYLHDYDVIAGGLGRWKPKATEDLLNQINRGTLLINFFGHGDPDTWAHESVLNRSRDLPKFQNENRLPLWVAATCTWGKYDDPINTSMSEDLIWLLQKGGIGIISASRPVFVFSNVQFAKDFYLYLFNNRSETLPSRLLGDAFFLAMRGEGSRNYQKYHLYGDPTMRLADPSHVVNIKSVQPDTLKAISTVTVKADVTSRSGELLNTFEGQAVLQCFDAVDSLFLSPANLQYNYRGGTIFKGIVTVSGGQLIGSFIVPKSIKYKKESTGRLSIYAWNEDTDAIGFIDTLLFFGSDQQVADTKGPEIEVSFKDIPNFFDGDYVSSQPTLVVELSDESGINLTGEVGHRIELIVDTNIKKDLTEFFVYNTDSYQNGKLEYTLPVLSTGNHELKILSWDNLNNYSERIISFRSSPLADLTLSEVVNFPNPFSQDTYFTFQMVSPVNEAEITISVYTLTGRKIQEIHEVARQGFNRIYWDGTDWDGDIIANGVYLYKILADDGQQTVEKIEKLAVIR